jgi:hypothetical protein
MDCLQRISADLRLDSLGAAVGRFIRSLSRTQSVLHLIQDRVAVDVSLQSLLSSLSDSTISFVRDELLSSPWFLDSHSMKEFCANLLVFIRVRSVPLYARLVAELHIHLESPCFMEYLGRLLCSGPDEQSSARLLQLLCERNLLSFDQVTQCLFARLIEHRVQSRSPGFLSVFGWPFLAFYFLPELSERFPLPVSAALSGTHTAGVRGVLSAVGRDWSRFRALRSAAQNPHPLAVALSRDDVSAFQRAFAEVDFCSQFEIPAWEFDNVNTVSLLSYAAECGAVNCVKYLLMNNASLQREDMEVAIAAGHHEIVRIFDEKQEQSPQEIDAELPRSVSYDVLMTCAVEHHRNEIFHWIIDTKFPDHEHLLSALARVLERVARANNFDAL